MKKIVPLVLVLAASGAQAQTTATATGASGKGATPAAVRGNAAPTPGLNGLLERVRLKVEQLTPSKKLGATTAVGGIRGSAVAASDVYWKSEAKPQFIDPDELAAFQKGVELIETDSVESARTALSSFLKTYPESPLRADASEMLTLLQEPAN